MSEGAMIVQIVAHPDDDLYFLNPDLACGIRAGEPIVTICVTCGETDGRNYAGGDPRLTDAPEDYAGYSGARQHGLMAAYADMAVGDRHSPWERTSLVVRGAIELEYVRLTAAPQVQLVFLNIAQDAGRHHAGNSARPRTLWSHEDLHLPTLRPVGSPVSGTYVYSRSDLLFTLMALLEMFQPSLIRTMDPDPDFQKHDANNPQHADYGDFSDHQDHTAVGRFAWQAIHTYLANGTARDCTVESYRGYYNERWPSNLSVTAFQRKLDSLAIYGWADEHDCHAAAGCGDRKVGGMARGTGWGQSMTYRYQPSTTWLQRNVDGRLTAFAVISGEALQWSEMYVGGPWHAPTRLGGGPLLPYLAIAQDNSGRMYLSGVRATFAADPANNRRDVVFAGQGEPGGAFGQWHVLGNPHDRRGDSPDSQMVTGMPAMAISDDGHVQIFVRNRGTGLSSRVQQSDALWSPWLDLHGFGVQDGLAAVTGYHGLKEVFAATKVGLTHWRERTANGPFARAQQPLFPPAGPPTVVVPKDDRLRMVVRHPGTGWVIGYRQVKPGGEWNGQPQMLCLESGFGPVATACVDDGIIIVQRHDSGAIMISKIDDDPSASLPPSPSLLPSDVNPVHAPAVALDGNGHVVVAIIGSDARLHVARAESPGDLPGRFSPATT